MIDFKDILNRLPAYGLNNLSKKTLWVYDDAVITPDNEPFPEEVEAVIDDLYTKTLKVRFNDEDANDTHCFLECNPELTKRLGFDMVCVCVYKAFDNEPIDSNFMFYKNRVSNHKALFIDIYDVANPRFHKTDNRRKIEQEFMNFIRDAQWVIDGVYEEELENMKYNDLEWLESDYDDTEEEK